MTSPLPLPEWVPWWVHLVLLLAILLFGLLFLLMPFSLFGVRARLEGLEVRLDEIQGEIRSLSLRLPEPRRMDDEYLVPDGRPPIPPAPVRPGTRVARPGEAGRGVGRSEPRLY